MPSEPNDAHEDLAVRLRRDAERLAAAYPPRRPAAFDRATRTVARPRVGRTFTLTAAVVALAVAIPWLLNRSPLPTRPGRSTASGSSSAPTAPLIAETTRRPATRSSRELASVMVDSLPTALPPSTDTTTPGFLTDVSEPELEALLDLWEHDDTETTRLSI